MGATERAFELTELRIQLGANVDPYAWWLPSLRDFRRDPRFVDIAERLKMTGLWRQIGWPDACEPLNDSFVCEQA